MCKPLREGGQRCYAHAQKALDKAREAHAVKRTSFTLEAIQNAQIDVASTPTGREEYEAERDAALASGDEGRASFFTSILDMGNQRRERNNEVARAVAHASATLPAPYDPTGRPPVEVDTHLADLGFEHAKVEGRIQSLTSRRYMTSTQAGQLGELEAQRGHLAAQLDAIDAEYGQRRWSRAWLVPGGHAHSSRHCSSCYPTTQYGLAYQMSGKSEAEIIDAAGERACTVCFPHAPTAVRNRPTRLFTAAEEAENAERATAAQSRAAAAATRASKAITTPTGEVLRDADGSIVKTEISAEREAVRVLANSLWYRHSSTMNGGEERPHPTEPKWQDYAVRAAEALAAKRGVSVEEVTAMLKAKGLAKYKRDCKEGGVTPIY